MIQYKILTSFLKKIVFLLLKILNVYIIKIYN